MRVYVVKDGKVVSSGPGGYLTESTGVDGRTQVSLSFWRDSKTEDVVVRTREDLLTRDVVECGYGCGTFMDQQVLEEYGGCAKCVEEKQQDVRDIIDCPGCGLFRGERRVIHAYGGCPTCAKQKHYEAVDEAYSKGAAATVYEKHYECSCCGDHVLAAVADTLGGLCPTCFKATPENLAAVPDTAFRAIGLSARIRVGHAFEVSFEDLGSLTREDVLEGGAKKWLDRVFKRLEAEREEIEERVYQLVDHWGSNAVKTPTERAVDWSGLRKYVEEASLVDWARITNQVDTSLRPESHLWSTDNMTQVSFDLKGATPTEAAYVKLQGTGDPPLYRLTARDGACDHSRSL